jgi:DNA-binding MarR family transcriptional regulator
MEVLSPHSIFKQIVMTGARLEALANRHLFGPLGLSSTTLSILHALSVRPHTAPSDLIREFSCTKSNITQRLNLLQKHGWILRSHSISGKDRRKIGIVLTPSGIQKLEDARKALKSHGALLERHLNGDEKTGCHLFLKKINSILDHYEHE